jgi:uncharacterized protein (DUF488 family)
MCALFTVGYEGRNIEDLVSLLTDNGVQTVVDVRELAISRRPGFSKTKLKENLESSGINYIHKSTLGSPRDIRHQLHEDNNYNVFFAEYRYHASQVLDDIVRVMYIAENVPTCLLCFESDAKTCHRSVLSAMMLSYSQTIDKVVDL